MGRIEDTLTRLETELIVDLDSLAHSEAVTAKTVRADLLALDKRFDSAAYVVQDKPHRGVAQLIVVDQDKFEQIKHELVSLPTFNEAATRRACILDRLLDAEDAIQLTRLAKEMAISRSTAASDLNVLRQQLSLHGVVISSKPNRGIYVLGDELAIREALLEDFYDDIYAGHEIK